MYRTILALALLTLSLSAAHADVKFSCRDLADSRNNIELVFSSDLHTAKVNAAVLQFGWIGEAAWIYNGKTKGGPKSLVVQETMLQGGIGQADLDGVSFRCTETK